MDRPSARRPLPALAFLLALSLLTALVWWRVIHRADSGNTNAEPSCSVATNTVVPRPAEVNVDVLNSTDRNHLARNVGSIMTKRGFHVTGVGNDDPNVVVNGVAEIRYGPKGSAAATLLSFYLPGARLIPVERSDSDVVVSLGLKYTAVATTATVAQKLKQQHIQQLPARNRALNVTPTPQSTPTC